MEKKKYYITTPIYYPSGKWHIGTCYTTIVCDALARFKRMQGYDTFYLTGTDEHGKKIQTKAKELGVTEMKYVNPIVGDLKALWKLLDISYDKFIRTTDDYHEKAVQKIYQKLYDQGDIYKGSYEGWYCVPCESFWTKTQLVDGKCPDCGREVEVTHEESYYLRMSKYTEQIKQLICDNEEFLQPRSRANEMYNNFIKDGLQDLAISRTTFDWGVKLPFDTKHVAYVWIDALSNYITALGYGSDDTTLLDKYWPAEVHMMGKEIVRFHSLIWPVMLLALGVPLPKKVYGHGWLLMGNDKISKSKGNVVDPYVLSERYGVDSLRYYLLREIPFGSDGAFSNSLFLGRINTDLCNNYGNLVSRTLAMVSSYNGGIVPKIGELDDTARDVIARGEALFDKVVAEMDALNVPNALELIFGFAGRCNKYIDETSPWQLAKDASKKEQLNTVLAVLCEGIRIVTVLLQPYLTKTPAKVFTALGVTKECDKSFDSIATWSSVLTGNTVSKIDHLFTRYDIVKETAEMEKLAEEIAKASEGKEEDGANTVTIEEITIDDFFKTKLKVANVTACERVPKADKLLQLTLQVGGETRTVVSGIAKHYTPEEMVGKQVVLVSNLKPAKLRGIESQGMILCAVDDEGGFSLVVPEKPIKSGGEVC